MNNKKEKSKENLAMTTTRVDRFWKELASVSQFLAALALETPREGLKDRQDLGPYVKKLNMELPELLKHSEIFYAGDYVPEDCKGAIEVRVPIAPKELPVPQERIKICFWICEKFPDGSRYCTKHCVVIDFPGPDFDWNFVIVIPAE